MDHMNKPAPYVNPDIFKLEQKRKAVLGHERGAGSKCLNCGDACPGLDLHYWRNICKACKCRRDDHDVHPEEVDHGKIIIGRLFDLDQAFDKQLKIGNGGIQHNITSKHSVSLSKKHIPCPNFDVQIRTTNYTTSTVRIDGNGTKSLKEVGSDFGHVTTNGSGDDFNKPSKQPPADRSSNLTRSFGQQPCKDEIVKYTWAPCQDPILVEKYFASLPYEERPITGTEGAQRRRQRLAYQLPIHDCDPDATRSTTTDQERQTHEKFVQTIKNEGCERCNASVQVGEIGVLTEHGNPCEIWHPNCFRCSACDQPLVDMLYFYKDGKYYCGRHFGNTMYPRCSACDELIFAKEYTRAEDKDWHLNHFACFGCDLELGGHRYMVKQEQPYCMDCYMKHFARVCQKCSDKIGPDVQRITHKELHWHATDQCFQCCNCHSTLLGKKFVIKNDSVFCNSECKREFMDKHLYSTVPE